MNLNVCVVIGGKDMVYQGKDLAARPHIVVATPGRFALILVMIFLKAIFNAIFGKFTEICIGVLLLECCL